MTINKSDLLKELVDEEERLTANDIEVAVNHIIDGICETLIQGNRLEVRGFGSLQLSHRQPRIGRNPKTGEKVAVPSRFSTQFTPGLKLRSRVDSFAEHEK